MRAVFVFAMIAVAFVTVQVHAATVVVTVTGEVEFNQITDPPLGNVNALDAAVLTFSVDSDVFTNSTSFPTRGYNIDPSSFVLRLGTVELGLENPFPGGQTPYFVIRDNDPAVDGFFVSTDVDFPVGVPIDQVGAFGQFLNNYSVTYTGDTLPSLDILDALGTYDFTGLTVFNWTIDDGPFNALGIVFSEMTIETNSGIFTDGFESGDTSAWTQTVPEACDPTFANAVLFPVGGGTGVLPIAANGTAWVAFVNDYQFHQIKAKNEDAIVDLEMEIWYPDPAFAGCPPADYSYNEVGTGLFLEEVHDTGLPGVDPIPNGTVWIRITNLVSSDGIFSVFDSD